MATSRGAVVAGCIGAGLLAAAMLGGRANEGPPLDPRSDSPDGTSALVSLLERLDSRVELSTGLPGGEDDVALLLRDRLDPPQRGEVLDWVRGGGTLVVTDPGSALVPGEALAAEPSQRELTRGACTVAALDDVAIVDGGSSVRYRSDGADGSCLGSRSYAFVVVRSEGEGTIVAMGGADAFTNDRLQHVDNAVLAVALLSPSAGTRVRFVDAPTPVGGGDKSLYELISDGLRRGALQLGLAFLIYAAWRAIRLGRPVREELPVEVAGSELVGATGRLLERSRSPAASAEVLRTRLRSAIRARLGLPAGVPEARLAELVADRGVDPSLARAALGNDAVTSDEELVAVARAVHSVQQEVLR